MVGFMKSVVQSREILVRADPGIFFLGKREKYDGCYLKIADICVTNVYLNTFVTVIFL